MKVSITVFLLSSLLAAHFSWGQTPTDSLSSYVKSYLAFEERNIALVNVKLVDGTGAETRAHQTILLSNGLIEKIGSVDSVEVPSNYRSLDLAGSTVIPGIVGTHNHLRFPQGALLFTGPRAYLAAGVTTIMTCGTGNPEEEISLSKAIKEGREPGPTIVNSGPYFTGPEGKANFVRFTNEQEVRDTIDYWFDRGVRWFKTYRNTPPESLKVIVDQVHKRGGKVTGHFCATTYEEAAKIGVDAVEHGFIHSFDHSEGKEEGVCSGRRNFRTELDINSEEVKRIHELLIENHVVLSSTLSIFEAQVPSRAFAEERSLELLAPYHVEAYQARRARMDEKGDSWYFKEKWLKQSMMYDRLFFELGGLLTAGPDPGLHSLPGFADQRNYELFTEAGFSTTDAIKVMTLNGAKSLGLEQLGSIEEGKQADLVVLDGNLEQDSSMIRNVEFVIKNGWAYDPEKLFSDVKGHMGSENDNSMKYLGRKSPDSIPEILAPNFISKRNEHEFGSVFSNNGLELFYGVHSFGKAETRHTKLENGVWSEPVTILSHEKYGYNDPFLSPDEQRLYFISNQAKAESEELDYDIWYVQRLDSGWSEPINAGMNSVANEYYVSFTSDTSMYFSSNRDQSSGYDIFKSKLEDGVYQKPEKLSEAVNSDEYEADVFVAPDESYLIFCSIREEGSGEGDLYISFKSDDGTWSQAKGMGDQINTDKHELCPVVTRDGKYFLFTRAGDIYWVDASIIETYR